MDVIRNAEEYVGHPISGHFPAEPEQVCVRVAVVYAYTFVFTSTNRSACPLLLLFRTWSQTR